MGQMVAAELCSFPEIQQITIVSRNPDRHKKLLQQLNGGSSKLHFLTADLDHCKNLSSLINGHDIVASAAGPFYKYEYKLAAAAIEAGAAYVSICDDADAAEQIFELDDSAQKNNIPVLTGIGWTPGLSSLLARTGAASLDNVNKINISWAGNSDDASGLAVILHTLHAFNGRVPSFLNGSLQLIPAGSGREKLRFPEPIGEISVYHVGHPEPVTMPQYFPGTSEITLKGGVNEDFLNKLTIMLGKLGLSRKGLSRDLLASVVRKVLPLLRKAAGPASDYSGIRVDIEGIYGRAICRSTYSAAGPMDILAGVPMAIAIRELARGKIKKTGVFAPEAPGVLDPQVFFNELEDRGVYIIKEEREIDLSRHCRANRLYNLRP